MTRAVTSGHDRVFALDHDVAVGVDQERAEGMVPLLARLPGKPDGRKEISIVGRHRFIQTLGLSARHRPRAGAASRLRRTFAYQLGGGSPIQ